MTAKQEKVEQWRAGFEAECHKVVCGPDLTRESDGYAHTPTHEYWLWYETGRKHEAELAYAREAKLLKYVQHFDHCAINEGQPAPFGLCCTCGLDALLEGGK